MDKYALAAVEAEAVHLALVLFVVRSCSVRACVALFAWTTGGLILSQSLSFVLYYASNTFPHCPRFFCIIFEYISALSSFLQPTQVVRAT